MLLLKSRFRLPARRRLQASPPEGSPGTCPRCHYSLRGLPPDTHACPECHTDITDLWTSRVRERIRRAKRMILSAAIYLVVSLAVTKVVAFAAGAAPLDDSPVITLLAICVSLILYCCGVVQVLHAIDLLYHWCISRRMLR